MSIFDMWRAQRGGSRTTPGVSGPSGAPSNTGGGGEDPQAVFNELMQGKPLTLEGLKSIEAELTRRTGARLEMNARGTGADLRLPGGQIVDVIGGMEGPEGSRRLQWLPDAAGGGAPGQPGAGGLPPGYSLTGPNRLSSFSAPGLAAPWTEEFQRPTPESIANDPSFKFQMERGMDAAQKSAAAKGTLLTGGTLRDLTEFGQGLASTFDDKYWNRAFQQYGMDRDTFWGNQTNAYNKLSGMAGTGLSAASSYAPGVAGLQTGGATSQANTTVGKNASLNALFTGLSEIGTAAAKKKWGSGVDPNAVKKPWGSGTVATGAT